METLFKNLAIKLLDDENGINEAAYVALLDLADAIRVGLASEIDDVVDATDGGFYIPDKLELPWGFTRREREDDEEEDSQPE